MHNSLFSHVKQYKVNSLKGWKLQFNSDVEDIPITELTADVPSFISSTYCNYTLFVCYF